MKMTAQQKEWLAESATTLKAEDLRPYFEIWALFDRLRNGGGSEEERLRFEKAFCRHYRLDGLGDKAFKQSYFKQMFALDLKGETTPYPRLLLALKRPASAGKPRMEFSFVSRLVAMHDEARPVYDGRVLRFLKLKPVPQGEDADRIKAYLETLDTIKATYDAWKPEYPRICGPLLQRLEPLRQCHCNKVWDFIVWQAGKKPSRRLPKPAPAQA